MKESSRLSFRESKVSQQLKAVNITSVEVLFSHLSYTETAEYVERLTPILLILNIMIVYCSIMKSGCKSLVASLRN